MNPNPAMHVLYLEIMSRHSAWGSLPLEKSMHSSRAAFSSLHTQHGYEFVSFSVQEARNID